MTWLWGVLAAGFHFLFFLLESVLWEKASVRVFKIPADVGLTPAMRTFAFNMGFYNLFLCLGALAGMALLCHGCAGGKAVLTFVCLSMVGAGLVLLVSRRRLLAPLIQAGPPALCLWSLWH